MAKKIDFLMAIHDHQPVGNFGWVFKEAYTQAYLPFFEVLERHPKIKMALHFSGPLLDWITENKPDFIKRLRKLVKEGRIEMLSGGYYEPILPMIHDRDKVGQIRMMSDFLKKDLGYQPRGLWLTERVWEPYLPKPLSQAGIEYIMVDDYHFKLAGLDPQNVFGYYVTEEEGNKLFIFPGSEKLRYLIPFKQVNECIDHLRSIASEGTRAVTYADDGEKFGLWPGTHKWVYDEKWLDNFFSALEDNLDWINLMTPSEYIDKAEPSGRIYLTCASYKEMMEWAGGYFRNFLVKYDESNNMHKKMTYISDKVEALSREEKSPAKVAQARKHLYMAQCNCAYWHGVFGGLYLSHLRTAIYNHLLEAEKIIDEVDQKGDWVRAQEMDFDKDGNDEVLISSNDLNLYIDPRNGGSIFEIDFKPKALNLTNTLTRRKESYHAKAIQKLAKGHDNTQGPGSIHELIGSKEENLDKILNYDWYRKACLLDHFLGDETDIDGFSRCKYREAGDFVNQPYLCKVKQDKKESKVELSRAGNIFLQSGAAPVNVKKTITHESGSSSFRVEYEIENTGSTEISPWFGIEFNLSIKDAQFNREGQVQGLRRLDIDDAWSGVKISMGSQKEADAWYFPVETVSESESGLERTYQGVTFMFNWKIGLAPRKKWGTSLDITVKE